MRRITSLKEKRGADNELIISANECRNLIYEFQNDVGDDILLPFELNAD